MGNTDLGSNVNNMLTVDAVDIIFCGITDSVFETGEILIHNFNVVTTAENTLIHDKVQISFMGCFFYPIVNCVSRSGQMVPEGETHTPSTHS